jgi:hypothetical protein
MAGALVGVDEYSLEMGGVILADTAKQVITMTERHGAYLGVDTSAVDLYGGIRRIPNCSRVIAR